MPRAKQRTPELRDRVLCSALAALEIDGVRGFTTRRVARDAHTSTPAVYELFGDRAGLVRAIFFEGFRRLAEDLGGLERTDDSRQDLIACIEAYRAFVIANPVLAQVMFSRPFVDFDPSGEDLAAGRHTRDLILDGVRRCIDARVLRGDPTDIAHVLVAVAHGLAAQETAGLLGTSKASRNRRWQLAIRATITGLGPQPGS
jgi:AcrR family transcriptional regulator